MLCMFKIWNALHAAETSKRNEIYSVAQDIPCYLQNPKFCARAHDMPLFWSKWSSTLFLYDSCQYYPLIYTQGSWGNIVGTVTTLWAECSRVQILEEARDFSTLWRCPEWPWGPPTSPIQWVPGASSGGRGGVKWPACEVDHSPLYSAGVKNEWSHTSTPICLHGVYRDNFTFTIYMLVLQEASSLQAFCPVFGTHFSFLSRIFTWHRLGSHW